MRQDLLGDFLICFFSKRDLARETTIKATSISIRFRIRRRGGILFRACSTRSSSFVGVVLLFSWAIAVTALESNGPRCFEMGRFLSRASGG